MPYTTVNEVRAMDAMDDTSIRETDLSEGIEWAEEIIDTYTGTSWTHKPFSARVGATHQGSALLRDDQNRPILFPRTITSVTEDGVAVNYSSWKLYPHGIVIRDGAFFGDTIIEGTAGITATPPIDIRWCARTLARQYVIDLASRIPDRALNMQTEFGYINLAQPGTHPDRPTALPEVNARLALRRQRPPSM